MVSVDACSRARGRQVFDRSLRERPVADEPAGGGIERGADRPRGTGGSGEAGADPSEDGQASSHPASRSPHRGISSRGSSWKRRYRTGNSSSVSTMLDAIPGERPAAESLGATLRAGARPPVLGIVPPPRSLRVVVAARQQVCPPGTHITRAARSAGGPQVRLGQQGRRFSSCGTALANRGSGMQGRSRLRVAGPAVLGVSAPLPRTEQ